MSYTIRQDRGYYAELPDLSDAIELAEKLLGGVHQDQPSTFTVENEDGYLLASVTNRRIVGVFTKQQWGGRKGDDALYCGEEDFDATDAILLMDHSALVELEDDSEETDEIGGNHVSWNGPRYVTIVGSICDFFGVDCVEDITEENLAYARNRMKPQPPAEEVVTLSVKLRLRVIPGASVAEFIENLDYSILSNTVGVTVSDAEIVDC